ncbi:hypothetical protein PM082_004626 [Marasmius tenuissimus]|nr:hypothetical protein PM082_004626 [Marasmius tenuissimus]
MRHRLNQPAHRIHSTELQGNGGVRVWGWTEQETEDVPGLDGRVYQKKSLLSALSSIETVQCRDLRDQHPTSNLAHLATKPRVVSSFRNSHPQATRWHPRSHNYGLDSTTCIFVIRSLLALYETLAAIWSIHAPNNTSPA